MENGLRKNRQGQLIPARYIQELWVEHNEIKVVSCHMAGGVSKNPYFDWLLKGGEAGDKITISWIDNLGKTDSNVHTIK